MAKQLFKRVNREPKREFHSWSPVMHSARVSPPDDLGRIYTYLVPIDGTIFDIMIYLEAAEPVPLIFEVVKFNRNRQALDFMVLPGSQGYQETLEVKKGERLQLFLRDSTKPYACIDFCFKLKLTREPERINNRVQIEEKDADE